MRNIDSTLIELRKLYGITQLQMAVALGTSQTNITRIEREISDRLASPSIPWDRDVVSTSQRVAWLARCGHYVTDMMSLMQPLSAIESPKVWRVAWALENTLYPLAHPLTNKPLILVFGNSAADWGLQSLVARKLCTGNPPEGEFPYLPDSDLPVLWKHNFERPEGRQLPFLFMSEKFRAKSFRAPSERTFRLGLSLTRPEGFFGEAIAFASAPILKFFDVLQLPFPKSSEAASTLLALARNAEICVLAAGTHKVSNLVKAVTLLRNKIDLLFLQPGVSSREFSSQIEQVCYFGDDYNLSDEDGDRIFALVKGVINSSFAKLEQKISDRESNVAESNSVGASDNWRISNFNRDLIDMHDLGHRLSDHSLSVSGRCGHIAMALVGATQYQDHQIRDLAEDFESVAFPERCAIELDYLKRL